MKSVDQAVVWWVVIFVALSIVSNIILMSRP